MARTENKRPYAQALADAEAFRASFPKECYERWEIAGSVRRKKDFVGDVEHVVIPAFGQGPGPGGGGLFGETVTVNLLWQRLEALLEAGGIGRGRFSKHVYGGFTGHDEEEGDGGGRWTNRWGPKYRGVDFLGFNHEIFTADARNWGSVLAIRTGPAELSKALVTDLKRFGYKNEGGYVRSLETSEVEPCASEERFFWMAGRQWVAPELRK